jgi:hypothetical protein
MEFLIVKAHFHDGKLFDLRTRLDRINIAKMLVGLPPEAAGRHLAKIFSVCKQAHEMAFTNAVAVLQTNMQIKHSEKSAALWQEILHERLWRLCLNWPGALAMAPEDAKAAKVAFADWRKKMPLANTDLAAFLAQTQALLAALPPALQQETALIAAIGRLLAVIAAQKPAPCWRFFAPPGWGAACVPKARGLLLHAVHLD